MGNGKKRLFRDVFIELPRFRVSLTRRCLPHSLPARYFHMQSRHPFITVSPFEVYRIVSRPFYENTYVLTQTGSSDCLVVDPGFEPEAIIEEIDEHKLNPTAIVLTHGHSDHIAGVSSMKQRWPSLPVLIGHGDAEKLTDPVANLSAGYGIDVKSPPADTLLREDEDLRVGEFCATVAEIPGHSVGHIVFWFASDPILVLAGDVLFHEGIGRTDFPDGDFSALEAGILNKLYRLPDSAIVLPGHGEPTTIGHEKKHNPFVPLP